MDRRETRAVVIQRPGGYDRLRVEPRPSPRPGPGEVVVRARAIGVNYADCVVRMGLYASAKKYVGWPITPGFELAGEVLAVGDGVTDLAPGEAVMAVTRFGGYATEVAVPRAQVFPLPAGFSMAQAAGFPTVALTAWYALFDLAQPREGDKVLVHSAAGGVGTALVQLARVAGAEVTGVVGGAHKVAVARAMGAAHVIDRSREDLWRRAESLAPEGFASIFDANGGDSLRASWAHLGAPGRLVVYGFHTMLPRRGGTPSWARLAWSWLRTPRFSPLAMTGENRSVMGFNLSYLFARHDVLRRAMGELLTHVAAGRMTSPPVTELPFDEVAEAHRRLESGATVGKLVLIV